MNRYENLLKKMCDSLIKRQIVHYGTPHDGGFLCDSCTVIHGRADNAVFPMIYMYSKSGEEKYLNCVRNLFHFQDSLTDIDGSVYNDGHTKWKGTTVFSAIFYFKSLYHFSDILPEDIKSELNVRLKNMSRWVYENIKIGFRSNVNYYAAASCLNAMCGKYFNEEKYLLRSRELFDYCLNLFSENGILAGEGQPHNSLTEKNCIPADMGYIFEESLPCLVDCGEFLEDEQALKFIAENAKKLLDFALPDGGIDNSFGSRNNKWTYYGSRTADGAISGMIKLSKYDVSFSEFAYLNANLIEKCFSDSVLYGGVMYEENGQPGCVHHLFSHAAGLADALASGLDENIKRGSLNFDFSKREYKYYPEIDTYKISTKKYLATVTGYDFRTYTYQNGASHSSGGALSMLFKKDTGPVIAGSVYEYSLSEPLNMQLPKGNIIISSLIPRLEYEKGGIKYATCLSSNAKIKAEEKENSLLIYVKTNFVRVSDWEAEDKELFAEIFYEFSDEKVLINVTKSKEKNGVKFILPVIENSAKIFTENKAEKRKIFSLSGGFSAEEFSFPCDEEIKITIM